jgi:RNA polymerase sigma-70 factor, ECF subfamily
MPEHLQTACRGFGADDPYIERNRRIPPVYGACHHPASGVLPRTVTHLHTYGHLSDSMGISQKKTRTEVLSETQLIAAARSGDHRAFTDLVKKYEETVYRFSFKVCRDERKAAETLQDTFINVYRKLSSFDGKSKFSTWLFTIVTNNCLMKNRRRKLSELEEPLSMYDEPPDERGTGHRNPVARWDETPADLLLDSELKEELDRAIQKLPVEYRSVFVLRDVEGHSTEETARALGITVEAAKSRLRRARAFLRDRLHNYMSTHP